MHLDSHVVKMPTESAQLLSTAHRVLDGKEKKIIDPDKGKVVKRWAHPDADMDAGLCMAFTPNNPLNIWTRKSSGNYEWLLALMEELCIEFSYRYNKIHGIAARLPYLRKLPKNIPIGPMTDFYLTMPDNYKGSDVVEAYRNLYIGEKSSFAKWTRREPPEWYIQGIERKQHDLYIQEQGNR